MLKTIKIKNYSPLIKKKKIAKKIVQRKLTSSSLAVAKAIKKAATKSPCKI